MAMDAIIADRLPRAGEQAGNGTAAYEKSDRAGTRGPL